MLDLDLDRGSSIREEKSKINVDREKWGVVFSLVTG